MKRIIYFSLLFLFVLTASVIAHLPASFVFNQIPKIRGLDVTGISGTIWHGQANEVRWQGTNAGQFRWNFSAMKLLQGKAEYALRFGRGSDIQLTGTGNMGYGLQGLYAERVLASIPVNAIMERAAIPFPIDAKGTVELTLNSFQYVQPWCGEAKGALVWNGSEIDSPLGTLELGTVFTDFTCSDNKLTLSGNHEAAQASGAMDTELTPDMRYKLSAWFKPGAELPEAMQSQLKWLGNPENDGRYIFELSGKL
ncbi:type II secretion system protein N [Vibrio sp. HN007]|uniref:type II secretion system protein N n=1 Tax=Vibrio iocasae TaxID=3098914 RepID=UPI0035D48E0E